MSWDIKHNRNEICELLKHTGEVVRVRIEGVRCYRSNELRYDICEADSGFRYEVGESSLRKIKAKRPGS
jgi:hypothetical protein